MGGNTPIPELLSMPTLGTDDYRIFPIPDGDVISQKKSECHMMAAIEFKFLSIELKNIFSECFNGFIFFLLFSCQIFSPIKKQKPSRTDPGRLILSK